MGRRSFVGMNLDDQTYDFSYEILSGADFTRSYITALFVGAELTGAKFEQCNVKTSDFTGAKLEGASFRGAAIDGAIFKCALLKGASFEGASEQGHIYGPKELP
jgi:uncharacterized protein YjbI with pentapeptide repeats